MQHPVIASPEVTRHLLRRFKLHTDKKLGQNFLTDPEIARRIAAAAALTPADTVLEIGAGIGSLTQWLAESGARVIAVELDQRLLPVLAVTLQGYANVRVVNADILKMDILRETGGPFKVCANLPYYITTPVILALLEQKLPMERMVVMVQKEVALRMAAAPGGREYGALSVAIQYYTEAALAFTVPATAFTPAPAVESAVMACTRRLRPPVAVEEKIFFRVVRAAFSQRRKMLSNALRTMGLDAAQCASWLQLADIDGNRRGETLNLEDFAALANTFAQL